MKFRVNMRGAVLTPFIIVAGLNYFGIAVAVNVEPAVLVLLVIFLDACLHDYIIFFFLARRHTAKVSHQRAKDSNQYYV